MRKLNSHQDVGHILCHIKECVSRGLKARKDHDEDDHELEEVQWTVGYVCVVAGLKSGHIKIRLAGILRGMLHEPMAGEACDAPLCRVKL